MIKHENGCFVFDLWVPAVKKTGPVNGKSDAKDLKTARVVKPTEVQNRYQAFNSNDQMDVSTVFVRQEDL